MAVARSGIASIIDLQRELEEAAQELSEAEDEWRGQDSPTEEHDSQQSGRQTRLNVGDHADRNSQEGNSYRVSEKEMRRNPCRDKSGDEAPIEQMLHSEDDKR
jgi:hypothetical protein